MEYFLGEIKYSPSTGKWISFQKLIKAYTKTEAEKKIEKYAIDNIAKQYHNYMFVTVFEAL